jgi:stage II sporulation protein D
MKVLKYIISLIFLFSALEITHVFAREITSDHLSQGHIFYFQGKPEAALKEYRQFVVLNPDNFEGWINLAIIYRDLDRYPEAIEAYKRAVDIKGDEPLAFCDLGWIYYDTGDSSRAYESFQKALNLMSGMPNPTVACETYYGLGSLYLGQQLYPIAEEKLKQAININHNYAPAYFALGLAYEAENRTDEAIHNFTRTLAADYNFVEAYIHLARLYFNQKLYEKAFRQYTKVTGIDPKNKEAIQKKEELLVLLAKKPEEIIPPKRINTNTTVRPVTKAETIPLLKIGIGVNESGQPLPKNKVYFKCGGEFRILTKDGNDILSQGKSGELWRIEVTATKDKLIIFDSLEHPVAEGDQDILIRLNDPQNNTIIIQNIGYGQGFHWGGEEDREYRGDIEIDLSPKYGLEVANIVNVEEYLYSVLPSEMITSWPLEALKAQAVIARGEALYKQKYVRPHGDLYDLCDDQHCQVYKGIKDESKKATEAVNATRGELLFYNDKIAHTLYSSNCGGHTQSSRELKGWGDEPYLEGVLDGPPDIKPPDSPWSLEKWIKSSPAVYCNLPSFCYPPEFRWIRVISADELTERINRVYHVGKIQRLTPLVRSKSGHLNSILIKGDQGEVIIEKEHLIRRSLAGGTLRSNLFLIQTRLGQDNQPVEFTIFGGGWGHAVGMCQTGAAGMASKEGASYQQILKHYYKDTLLKKLDY